MNTLKELHIEQQKYVWRIRVAGREGGGRDNENVWYANGFSLENNMIICSAILITFKDGDGYSLTGRRLCENGFIHELKVVFNCPLRGIVILKEKEESLSDGSFGVLVEEMNLKNNENIYTTTTFERPIGVFLPARVVYECEHSAICMSIDDESCFEYIPGEESKSKNMVMGDIFNANTLKSESDIIDVKWLIYSIPVIVCDGIPPSSLGAGGPLTTRDGKIVGMLTMGHSRQSYGLAIQSTVIQECVEEYKSEQIKIKEVKGKKRKVREEERGGSEKQPKKRKRSQEAKHTKTEGSPLLQELNPSIGYLHSLGLKESDADGFVENVLVNGKPWTSGVPVLLSGSHVFVCAHASRDMRCGVGGPALIEKFKEEIDSSGLNDQVFVSSCSHVGGHKYAGNLIIFSADAEGKDAGHWGQMSPSVKEAEKVDETEKKIPNGKHVEEAVKPNGDSKQAETESVASCCQGDNAVSCCRETSPAERETSEEIKKNGESKLLCFMLHGVATVAYSFYKMSRGLKESDVDGFVEDVLVNGKPWASGVPEVLSGSHVFVCAHASGDMRCGVGGPALIEKFKEEIDSNGLNDQVFVSSCSHVGGHKYAGNLIIFSADAEGKDAGQWYRYATPYDVSAFLDQHTAKGEIIENMWRGQIGASIEEAEKVDETEKKIPNGKHVEEAAKPNGDGINQKTCLTVCEAIEASKFADGDILIFPEMIKYRGLKESDVDGFVEDVLVNGKPWASGVPEVLTGSHVFVCAHASRDMRCGVCGPALIEKFKEAIDSRGLNDQVFVGGCSHVGGHKYTGNLIISSADVEGKIAGHWYGYATPNDVAAFLDQHIAKGEIIKNLWRGQMGASVEEAEKVDETEMKALNGKHVEEAVKPNGDGKQVESEIVASCCQGANVVSCCRDASPEERET